MNEVKQIGNYRQGGAWDNPQTGRVYSSDGISPTLNTCGGGDREVKIIEPFIVASRGRNPQNTSDRTPGADTEQRLELNSEGICNTLTSVQKDNLVLEPKLVGGIGEKNWGKQWIQGDRVYDSEAVAMAITAQPLGNTGGNSYLYLVDETEGVKEYGTEEERNTIELLSALRKEIGEECFQQWAIGIFECFSEEKILQSELYEESIYDDWREQPGIFDSAWNGEDNQQSSFAERLLRDMWEEWKIGRASQGRELPEQLTGQLDDFMQKLSHEGTQGEKYLYYLWKACEGIELLQQTLSEIQEIRRSDVSQNCGYRIRKLIPLETWRLMGFTDEDFRKAEQVNSNTQLYKQAGNSIVVNVLEAIFKQLM